LTTRARFAEVFAAVYVHGRPLGPLSVDDFRRQVKAMGEADDAVLALADDGLDAAGDRAHRILSRLHDIGFRRPPLVRG
jgi:hypothetical protein